MPELRPGEMVAVDNLSSHKLRWTRKRIEAGGAVLNFLQPYSPDHARDYLRHCGWPLQKA